MSALFKSKPSEGYKSVAIVRPGDKVMPLGTLDSYRPLDSIRTICFFIVRHQLDEAHLRASLDKLIREHLPILGARIEGKIGPNERQSYRLPQPFPDDYELFKWSSKSVSTPFDESNILPSTKDPKSAVIWGRPIPEIEKDLSPDTPDWPVERKYEQPDCPLLLVHLTKYPDATVVTTNLSHSVCDQMGYGSFVRAWLQVAKGETPTKFLELDPDELSGSTPSLGGLQKKGSYRVPTKMEQLAAMASYAPESMSQPDEDRRLAFLPASAINKLKERCQREIKEKYGEEMHLSSADVIAGVVVKLGQLHRKKPKTLLLSGTMNARGRHPSLPADKPYLHNAITYSSTNFPVSCNTRLFEVVRKNRLSVTEALKPEMVNRSMAVTKALREAGRSIMMIESGWTSLAVTNWCSAWRGTDFSPVVVNKEAVKAEETNGLTNGHAVDPETTQVNGEPTQINGEAIQVNGESSPKPSATGEGSTEPAGTAEGALRMEPEISTAKPIVLGHALQRHVKFCRFTCQVMSYEQDGFWIDFSTSTKNMPLVEALLKKDPFLETI